MFTNKAIASILCLLILLTGCTEPYMPHIDQGPGEAIVVNGQVTDREGYQVISISVTSPFNDPGYLPLSGCKVEIHDQEEHVFTGEESEPGKYSVWIDKEFLEPGTSYRARIITPGGEEILSAYDMMPAPAVIDTIYFEREERTAGVTGRTVPGLQFYADITGTGSDSRHYRLSIEETWEYHTLYPIEGYYDGRVMYVYPPDYSKNVCWKTQLVKNIFTMSTVPLVDNFHKGYPLQFTDNTTKKLLIGYSPLVTLYAVSEASYDYWEQQRVNSEDQGGLYDHQPVQVRGNLENTTDPEKKVLGFFGAAAMDQKRIFVEGIEDMEFPDDLNLCEPMSLGREGWRQFRRSDYPIYFVGSQLQVEKICVDCTYQGGVTSKPAFWIW